VILGEAFDHAGWSVAHTQITPSATTNRISKRTKTTNGTRRLILLKLTTAPEDTSSAEGHARFDVP